MTVISLTALFLACPSGDSSGGGNKTPKAGDYTIAGPKTGASPWTVDFDGTAKKVNITPRTEGVGAVTKITYGDIGTTEPSAVGYYEVKFEVAAGTGYDAATDLYAGTIIIQAAGGVVKKPVASHYLVSGKDDVVYSATTKVGTVTVQNGNTTPKELNVVPREGFSAGVPVVKYNGGDTKPTVKGSYNVTFNVPAAGEWEAAEDLVAGTLILLGPEQTASTPARTDYRVTVGTETFQDGGTLSVQYKASKIEVTVDRLSGSPAVPNKPTYLKSGETEESNVAPMDIGDYTVKFYVPGIEDGNTVWAPREFTAGTLKITKIDLTIADFDFDTSGGANGGGTAGGGGMLTQSVPGDLKDANGTVIGTIDNPTELKVIPKTGSLLPATAAIEVLYAGKTLAEVTTQGVGKYAISINVTAGADDFWNPLTGLALGKDFELLPITTVVPSYNLFWVKDGQLALTSGNQVYVQQYSASNNTATLTIGPTAASIAAGYTVIEWRVNGINVANSGDRYTFWSNSLGRHTVSFIVKDPDKDEYYSAEIVVVVGTTPAL